MTATYRADYHYADCYMMMDEALRSGRVVRKFQMFLEAFNEFQRCQAARRRHRAYNTKVYRYGDEMYGRSIYDRLTIRASRLTNELTISVEKEPDDV